MKTASRLFFIILISLGLRGLQPEIAFAQDIALEPVANGFDQPVDIQNAGDDRLFIVEQGGRIKILNADGSVNTAPFLNLSAQVSTGYERGLLGLAFHPDYGSNGYFYVNYTDTAGDTQVSRFSVDTTDPDLADDSSELPLLSIDQDFANHNGGGLTFGPDGMLYISSGDGGSGNDPNDNAQDLGTLLGKILRIDVDLSAPYIPADNPFVGEPDAMDEIWAYGLRNPWRFSFDHTAGDIWIGDVGQNLWEEVNRQPATAAGLNYGWRCYEGNVLNTNVDTEDCPDASELVFPVAVYPINNMPECTVVGGRVYRGAEFPDLYGLYFFADHCSGRIWTIDGQDNVVNHGTLGASNITGFGVGHDDELYLSAFSGGGTIYKIGDPDLSVDKAPAPVAFELYPNPADSILTVTFGNADIRRLTLYDLRGREVYTHDTTGKTNHTIPLAGLSKGVYILSATHTRGRKAYKELMVR